MDVGETSGYQWMGQFILWLLLFFSQMKLQEVFSMFGLIFEIQVFDSSEHTDGTFISTQLE